MRLQWDEMQDLLAPLSLERRQVWVLAEIHQMTIAKIAATLEISPNTVSTRLQLARAEFEAAVARKRAAEQRRSRRASVPLVLPLDAAALTRTAGSLPMPALPTATIARIWRGVQDRRAQYAAEPGTTRPRLRLTSAASHGFALSVGVVLGVLLTMQLVNARGAEPLPVALRGEPVPVAAPSSMAPPATLDSVIEPPADSARSAAHPASSSETELPELRLVEQILAPR